VRVTSDFLDTAIRISSIATGPDSANWHWHKLAQDVLDHAPPHVLNDWARDFLTSIPNQLRPLTDKQQRCIHKYYVRAFGAEPRD
jgi:hypothetical protein